MWDVEEKEEILKIPNLDIAQWQFLINVADYDPRLKKETQEKLMAAIKENQMAPFYQDFCDDLRNNF